MSKGVSDKDFSSTYLRDKRVRFSTETKSNDGFKVPRTRSVALIEGLPIEEEEIPTDVLSSKRKLTYSPSKSQSSPQIRTKRAISTVETGSPSKRPMSSKKQKSQKTPTDPPSTVPNSGSGSKKKKPAQSLSKLATRQKSTRKKARIVTKSFHSAKSRMSPKLLNYVLECLESYEQWKAIDEIGFGGVYWLRVSKIPMQLGYWLLSNYEPAKNALILPDGQELQLKPIDVHATLGLPMGPKKVQLASFSEASDEFADFYQSWRDQFVHESGTITTKTLAQFLVNQVEAGDLFKINFVVLVVTLLIQGTQKSNANFRVLKSLMVVDEIPNYNWCEYVLESLRDSQIAWLKSNKKSFVTGPLLILMLVYVDRVVHRSRTVDRDYFTLVGWTTRELYLREKQEKAYGKFGVGMIEDVMTEDVVISTTQQDVKDYVLDLAVTTKTVSDQLFLLQSKLHSGSSVLPPNETVNKLRDVARSLLDGSSEMVIDVAKSVGSVSPTLSPDDEFFNLPEVTAALEAADKLAKMKQSSSKSPEVYSSPKAYIQDFSVSTRKLAQNMVSLDEKVEIGVTNFPDNELMKSLHSTTSLLYRSYGGCDEPAPSTLLNADDLDDAYAIAACEAVEKAYNRKRIYKPTGSQFHPFQYQSQPNIIGDNAKEFCSVVAKEVNDGFYDHDREEFGFMDGTSTDVGNDASGCDTVAKEVGTSTDVRAEDEVKEDFGEDEKEVRPDVDKEVLGDDGNAASRGDGNVERDVGKEVLIDMDDDKSVDSEATESDPEDIFEIFDNLSSPQTSLAIAPADDHAIIRRRASIVPQVPEYCSPFVIRITDIGAAITKTQRMLSDYVFNQDATKINGDNEVLFDYKSHSVVRFTFRSLRPHTHVSSGILDLWASCLNHGETRKSKATPLRFYGSSLIFRMVMSAKLKTDEQRIKCFKDVLDGELEECYWFQLKSIDMFFFPISMRNHFFLFVFDLKNNGFYILDNRQSRASVENLYDMVPHIMQTALAHYLMNKEDTHAKGKAVMGMKAVNVKMPWRSVSNNEDCGIFTMRHMETFKGDTKWNCGIKKNDDATLEKLRLKYCASLILFKGNKVSNEIISRAKEFQKKNCSTS